jgi:hypothetical protein
MKVGITGIIKKDLTVTYNYGKRTAIFCFVGEHPFQEGIWDIKHSSKVFIPIITRS